MLNVLLPCLFAVAVSAAPSAAPAPQTSAPPAVAAASRAVASRVAPSAFRIRKLHLVRPDLIPYPLAYSVYC